MRLQKKNRANIQKQSKPTKHLVYFQGVIVNHIADLSKLVGLGFHHPKNHPALPKPKNQAYGNFTI